MIEDDGLGTALGLAALAGVVDDEGIEMGHGPQGPFGKAAVRQAHPLARQPFEVAVLAHMHQHLGAEAAAQPQVLGQIGVGRRQIGAVIAERGITVVAALGLDQHHDVAEAQAAHGKAGAGGTGLQPAVLVRRAPDRLQLTSARLRQLLVPGEIAVQRQLIERGAMAAFGIVAAACQQLLNQRFAICGKGGITEVVTVLAQPLQHRGRARRGVEADAVGQAAVAGRVVGQHQGDAALRCRCLSQPDPGLGEGGDPVETLPVGLQPQQCRAQTRRRRRLLRIGVASAAAGLRRRGQLGSRRRILSS